SPSSASVLETKPQSYGYSRPTGRGCPQRMASSSGSYFILSLLPRWASTTTCTRSFFVQVGMRSSLTSRLVAIGLARRKVVRAVEQRNRTTRATLARRSTGFEDQAGHQARRLYQDEVLRGDAGPHKRYRCRGAGQTI